MTHDEVRELIDKHWNNERITLEWLQFETDLIKVLSSGLPSKTIVAATKELVDAFTKRGHFHDYQRYLTNAKRRSKHNVSRQRT